jgi:hypothetical protein
MTKGIAARTSTVTRLSPVKAEAVTLHRLTVTGATAGSSSRAPTAVSRFIQAPQLILLPRLP